MKALISVVLGSYNRRRFLKTTLASIRENGITVPYEMIVVDGGSTDGTIEHLVAQKDVIAIVQHNRGEWRGKPIERRSWGYFMNLAFKAAQGKYVVMVSDDCLLVPGTVQNAYDEFEERLARGDSLGALAFYWREWPSEAEYKVGRTLGGRMFVNHGMYLRRVVEEVGWCDEEHYRFYHADADLCLRIWRAGHRVEACESAYVEHFAHANVAIRQSNLDHEHGDWESLLERWRDIASETAGGDRGSWKTKSYEDPYQTARTFERVRPKKFARIPGTGLLRRAMRKALGKGAG